MFSLNIVRVNGIFNLLNWTDINNSSFVDIPTHGKKMQARHCVEQECCLAALLLRDWLYGKIPVSGCSRILCTSCDAQLAVLSVGKGGANVLN